MSKLGIVRLVPYLGIQYSTLKSKAKVQEEIIDLSIKRLLQHLQLSLFDKLLPNYKEIYIRIWRKDQLNRKFRIKEL